MFSIGRKEQPWSLILYGKPKVGKTTFAAEAPGAFIFDFERGSNFIETVPKLAVTHTSQWRTQLSEIVNLKEAEIEGKKFPLQTAVIDSLSALTLMHTREICQEHNRASLDKFDFGRGYEELRARIEKIIDLVTWFKEKGKNVILLAHETREQVTDLVAGDHSLVTLSVSSGSYKKDKDIAEKLTSQFDAVLYMKMAIQKIEDSNQVAQNSSRLIHSKGHPGAVIGTRFKSMPDVYSVQPEGKNSAFWEFLK
ncbi:MAG: ATP-binding protein [Waterburya sp.]